MNASSLPSSFRSSTLASLSACAAAACLSTGAMAQTNVTLYGAIGLDLLSATHVYNGTTSGTVTKIDDNAIVNSRIGLKASEDLGQGLKAIFNLESSVSPDTGKANSTFWNRGAYVGLAGDFGSVKLGHQWNVADDYMGNYFVFGYYSPFLMTGFYALSDYYDNAIKYTLPRLGGFEGAVLYSAGEVAGKSAAGQKFQAAGTYAVGPFSVGLTAFSEKDPNGVATNTLYAGGASYDAGVAKARLGLALADVKYSYNGTTKLTSTDAAFKGRVIDLGVDVPITPQYTASLDYVLNDKSDSPDDTYFVRARASYALSKRTSLNANLIYLKNKGNANFAFVSGQSGFAGEAGQSQTILTAGITHSF
ncbi:porin [Aquabacterium sp.]|uniref:porin n=1 Tax=Aquabacterium sp. TaxID=1872578 RepID=UPI0025BDD668|nr:porin [Aquabacterium sp.]